MRNCASEVLKAIEKKYGIILKLDDSNEEQCHLKILDCPNNVISIIEREINDEISRKRVKAFKTDYKTGLKRALEDNKSFAHEISNLESNHLI